jgi:ABC-type sugar transport system substrate-binding protein
MKKLLIIILIIVVAASLSVACSNNTSSEENTPADTSASEDAATEPEPAAETDSGTDAVPEDAAPAPPEGRVAAEKAADNPIRIAFLTWQNNPFFMSVKGGADAVADYLSNFNCTVDYVSMGEDLTADRAIAGLEAAIQKEYDGIVVCSVCEGTEEYIDKAVDAGIPVATWCAESSNAGKRLFFYGQNSYDAGQLHGSLIEEYTGGSGKVGVITGVLGAASHDARMNGAIDYLKEKCPDVEIIGPYENEDKGEVAYTQVQDMLTANPDLKAVYVTAGGPFGAAKAVQDAGLTGKVGVFAYDHTPENLEYVASGEIVGCVDQDPFGQGFDTNVIMFNYLVNGTEPSSDFIECKLDVVTPDTIKDMYPEYAN